MRFLVMSALVACAACGGDGDKGSEKEPPGDSGMMADDVDHDASVEPGEDAAAPPSDDAGIPPSDDAGIPPSDDAGMTSDDIPTPASGKAIFRATFVDVSEDFNGGGEEPFAGVESAGSAVSALNAARWASADEAEVGTGHYIQIRVDELWPQVGMTYAAAKGAGVEETALSYGRYDTGAWNCDGSITITALDGSTYSFTFESTSCTATGAPAMGSVNIIGEGRATHPY
jgi:hypothetical protein